MADEHEWVVPEGVNEAKCDHDLLNSEERKKPWLKKGSPALKALTKIVMDTRFINTLPYYVNFRYVLLFAFCNHLLFIEGK